MKVHRAPVVKEEVVDVSQGCHGLAKGWRGASRGFILMLVVAEKFSKLDCEKKIQRLVVCLEVFMTVNIDQEKVMDMVQTVKALLSDNGSR